MQGGEIFIPKIPSMRVMDMAECIAPEAEKKVIGIRAGEKMNEILLTEEMAAHAWELEDYFVIEPEHPFWGENKLENAKRLPQGFQYTSGNNDWWLTEAELSNMIEEL